MILSKLWILLLALDPHATFPIQLCHLHPSHPNKGRRTPYHLHQRRWCISFPESQGGCVSTSSSSNLWQISAQTWMERGKRMHIPRTIDTYVRHWIMGYQHGYHYSWDMHAPVVKTWLKEMLRIYITPMSRYVCIYVMYACYVCMYVCTHVCMYATYAMIWYVCIYVCI